MLLSELAALDEALDEARFIQAHPAPALVFLLGVPKKPSPLERAWEFFSGAGSALAIASGAAASAEDALRAMARTTESTGPAKVFRVTPASPIFFLEKPLVKIGRTPDNDIAINEQRVSRSHAFLEQVTPEEWLLKDQGAVNGTFCDDKSVAFKGQVPVKDGTTIGLSPDVKAQFVTPKTLALLAKKCRERKIR